MTIRAGTGLLLVLAALPRAAAAQSCLGNCNGDDRVAFNELITGVNIGPGRTTCPAFSTLR